MGYTRQILQKLQNFQFSQTCRFKRIIWYKRTTEYGLGAFHFISNFVQFRQDYRGKSQNLRVPSIISFIQYFWKIWLENISQDFLFGGICPRASFLYNISEKDLPSGSIWQVGMTSPTWLDKRQHVQIFSFKKYSDLFSQIYLALMKTYAKLHDDVMSESQSHSYRFGKIFE